MGSNFSSDEQNNTSILKIKSRRGEDLLYRLQLDLDNSFAEKQVDITYN